MANPINLKIITLEGVFFSGDVSEIILPTDTGQITILPGHIPLISKIKEGKITIRTEIEERKYKISSGVLEVRPKSEVYLLIDKIME